MIKRILLLSAYVLMSANLFAQPLSVGQYNIRYANPMDKKDGNGWEVRRQKMYDLINYEQWDLFCAQEALHNQIEDLKANLDGYSYVGSGRDDGKTKGEYAPIFYKKSRINCLDNGVFWLSKTPDVVGSKDWDAALCRICTWAYLEDRSTKWRFWVFNLHMDHKGEVSRLESAKLVLSKIKEKCGNEPYILAGDFNANQNEAPYRFLIESGDLRDTYNAAKRRMAETGSMNTFIPTKKTDERIDHVLVSPQFKVHRYGLLTYNYWSPIEGVELPSEADADSIPTHTIQMISDHYPVNVTLELPRLRASQDWAQYGVFKKENATDKNVKVVFMGNSITWNWRRFYPEFFKNNEGYVCRGISGQVTAQMLARFRSDVINLHPKYVVILAGTNDIAMNQGYVSIDHIYENIVSMCELAKANGIKPVLCSVLPADRYSWSWEIDRERAINSIRELNDKLREYAKKKKFPYADYFSEMVDENQALKKEYQQDAVHPNKEGYLVMEKVIQKLLKK